MPVAAVSDTHHGPLERTHHHSALKPNRLHNDDDPGLIPRVVVVVWGDAGVGRAMDRAAARERLPSNFRATTEYLPSNARHLRVQLVVEGWQLLNGAHEHRWLEADRGEAAS